MLRKLFLILCLAFAVVAFGYPCVVLPVGSYKTNIISSEKLNISTTYEFGWNGKVKISIVATGKDEEGNDKEVSNISTEQYYKLTGKKSIQISEDEKFDENDQTIYIASIFRLDGNATNQVAMWISIGVCAFALLLIVTIPRRRKN